MLKNLSGFFRSNARVMDPAGPYACGRYATITAAGFDPEGSGLSPIFWRTGIVQFLPTLSETQIGKRISKELFMSDELKSKLKDLVYECDLETIKGATARFIRDVAEYHKKHGFLTPAQAEAIIKIHKETF